MNNIEKQFRERIFQSIQKVVCKSANLEYKKLDWGHVRSGKPVREGAKLSQARNVVCYLATEFWGMNNLEVASLFGLNSKSVVSYMRGNVQRQIAANPSHATVLSNLADAVIYQAALDRGFIKPQQK